MTHYFIVKVQTDDASITAQTLCDEMLSNLESINVEALVSPLPDLGEDLHTLYISTVDSTEPMECTAALANFVGDMLVALGIDVPIIDDVRASQHTNLDKFNLG